MWGEPLDNAVEQMAACAEEAEYVALMADHHLGYSVPIGGVLAYDNKVSPSAVGFDIACGNKAVRLDVDAQEVQAHIGETMNEIFAAISFGIGRKNTQLVAADLFFDANSPDFWGFYPIFGVFSHQIDPRAPIKYPKSTFLCDPYLSLLFKSLWRWCWRHRCGPSAGRGTTSRGRK